MSKNNKKRLYITCECFEGIDCDPIQNKKEY